jgi:hypothetical protein
MDKDGDWAKSPIPPHKNKNAIKAIALKAFEIDSALVEQQT